MNPGELLNRALDIRQETWEQFPEYSNIISGISFRLSNKMTRKAGIAYYRNNIIKLSIPLLCNPENEKDIRETVLHEIAHLLTPYQRHNEIWRAVALKIGSNGKRCHSMAVTRKKREGWETIACNKCNTLITIGPVRIQRLLSGMAYRHKACGGLLKEMEF